MLQSNLSPERLKILPKNRVENRQATGKSFAMRLTSYFFVRQKGTYKVFMLLGHRDTGKVVFRRNFGQGFTGRSGLEILNSGLNLRKFRNNTLNNLFELRIRFTRLRLLNFSDFNF